MVLTELACALVRVSWSSGRKILTHEGPCAP